MKSSTVKLVAIIIALALIITSLSFVVFMPMAYGLTDDLTKQVTLKDSEMTDDEKSEVMINRLNLLYQYINLLDYNYKDEVDINDLIDGAYKGTTEALGDKFSEYYETVTGAQEFTEYVNNTFVGIGVRISTTAEGSTVIDALIAGGPAEKVGLKPGDIFVKIDGEDASKWDNSIVSQHLRGEENTSVSVTVLRGGKTYDYTIKRSKVSDSSMTGVMTLFEGIGYIDINKFDQDTSDEFAIIYDQLSEQGAKAYIIDLRDNTGGYTDQAEKIADYILEGHIITQYETQGNIVTTKKANDGHKLSEPIVLLVNKNTASSAELLAGALQEAGYKLVGDKTYGKGYSQVMKTLVDGHDFKLSTTYFLVGDKGKKITTEGLTPDYYVAGSGLSAEELAAVGEEASKFAAFSYADKPSAGMSGLTVYAAQQRLGILGYDTSFTGTLDAQTIAAMKTFQGDYGLFAYAVLDFSTQKMLDAALLQLTSGNTNSGAQEERAVEVIQGMMK